MAFKFNDNQKDLINQGIVQDNEGNFIESFTNLFNEMGYFFITPKPTKKYRAIIKSKHGIDSFYLPKPLPTGVCMQIIQVTNLYKITTSKNYNLFSH